MNKTTLVSLIILFSISFLQMDCKDEPPVTVDPPPTGPDTTSHNFTWTTYTFAGNFGSSGFKDVAIINDSDIWAVGAIYTSPETAYNAAHWDGKTWKLFQIPFYTICGQLSKTPYPASSVFLLNPTSTWIAMDGSQIAKYNGTTFIGTICLPISFSVAKLWGTDQNSVYAVGSNGIILHFDGTTWSKQESGTTIDLRDVWGSLDGKTVWACGESNDNLHSILIKYENGQWKTLWQRDGLTPVQPYGNNVGSIWSNNQTTYITSSNGVYQLKDTVTTKMSNNFSTFSRNLRGNSEFDMLTTGEGGRIWHYNGIGWKLIIEKPNYFLIGSTIKNNIAIAVGTDFSIGLGAGLIYVGRRQ